MAASILRYALIGKARTCPDIFMLVFGPCAQKLGQKPKSTPKDIKL